MKQDWIEEFAGKRIAIWGYGMEGRSTYRLIHELCPELSVDIIDTKESTLKKAEAECPTGHCLLQKDADFSVYDRIMKAPGIVVPENMRNLPITGETQLFLKHYRERTVGITGTKGKSTTASLTAALLSEVGPTVLVGNIGKACFDAIDEMENGAMAAFEISCHQLEFCQVSPHVAVYLDLYEEHLDHYGSFEKYGLAKSHIYAYQKEGDVALLDGNLPAFLPACDHAFRIGKDVYNQGKTLFIPGHSVDVSDCKLLGDHNYRNFACAWFAASQFSVTEEMVRHAASSFTPLRHRLEDLGVWNGVRYVNDSISTIGQASIKALQALPETDVILIGGMDRGISYAELEDYLVKSQVKVVFMYATGKRILQEMEEKGLCSDRFYYEQDLRAAVKTAQEIAVPGKIVLLSPAASSYDSFKNFEDRGDQFRALVEEAA